MLKLPCVKDEREICQCPPLTTKHQFIRVKEENRCDCLWLPDRRMQLVLNLLEKVYLQDSQFPRVPEAMFETRLNHLGECLKIPDHAKQIPSLEDDC